MQREVVNLKSRASKYEILIGADLLSTLGEEIRLRVGRGAQRIALISNQKVCDLYGQNVLASLRDAGFEVGTWLMKDGERHKSLRSFEQVLAFLSESGLQRSDIVVALGGGVVGDLAGFAAATYLRGVDFIQVPTTLLAQIDSSVGGKTGINLAGGKNLVGAFHQPRLVLIDTATLRTLPLRELTAGWCEAVKQGAVGDRKLFDQTVRLLSRTTYAPEKQSAKDLRTGLPDIAATIAAHCRFKASIVAGDEREELARDDSRSRRILNFGHTTAHALEAVTGYRRFRHGEAVGHGMLVAGELSKNIGMLAAGELKSLRSAVALCGPLPSASDINVGELIKAMKADKKSVAGKMSWVLLEALGKGRIVAGDEISSRTLRASLRDGLSQDEK
jgi:3-dehydroquinate synthase